MESHLPFHRQEHKEEGSFFIRVDSSMSVLFIFVGNQILFSSSLLQFIFVDDKKMKETMLRDIEENQLPNIYGGKHPLVPVEDT